MASIPTVDPSFRERYLRKRNAPSTLCKIGRMRKRDKDAARVQRTAELLLDVAEAGGDIEAAAVAIAPLDIPSWLYRHTGSHLWPLNVERMAKVRYLAEKHK